MKKITFKSGHSIIVEDIIIEKLHEMLSVNNRESINPYKWFFDYNGKGSRTVIHFFDIESIQDAKGFKEKYITIGIFIACTIIVAVGLLAELFK